MKILLWLITVAAATSDNSGCVEGDGDNHLLSYTGLSSISFAPCSNIHIVNHLLYFQSPTKLEKWYHTLPRLLWWRRSQTSWLSVDLPSLSSVCLHLPWSNPFCHSFQKIDTQTLWRGPTFFVLVDEKILWDLFCCIKLRVMTENPEKHQPKIDNSEMVKRQKWGSSFHRQRTSDDDKITVGWLCHRCGGDMIERVGLVSLTVTPGCDSPTSFTSYTSATI